MTLLCQFPAKELHSGYHVTIGKASGEAPREQIHTTEPEITLILSYSAYHVQIRAVNDVSSSPALSHVIPWRQDKPSESSFFSAKMNHLKASILLFTGYKIISYTFFFFAGLRAGKLNVTVQSNTSFTIRWGDNLIPNYVCYSAEWTTTGQKTAHRSFFEHKNNYMSLSRLPGLQIFD